MYIKIKSPERFSLLLQLIASGILCAAIFFLLLPILFVGDIHLAWEQIRAIFQEFKHDEGVLVAYGTVIVICALPVFFLKGVWNWFQKRKQWTKPSTVRALDFEHDGVSVITCEGNYFLPYQETQLTVDSQIITVRTKNNRYPTIAAITFHFSQAGGTTFTVNHKPTNDTLYQIANFYPQFQQLTFHFTLSSPNDTDQQQLANFLQEQLENQRLYGFHVKYRNHWLLLLFALLFCALPLLPTFMLDGFWSDFAFPFFWIFAILMLGMLAGGIAMLYGTCKDLKVKRKLARLRSQNH